MSATDSVQTPPWRCPGPVEVVTELPYDLHAVLVRRCEAREPNSCVEMCDGCWALREVDAA